MVCLPLTIAVSSSGFRQSSMTALECISEGKMYQVIAKSRHISIKEKESMYKGLSGYLNITGIRDYIVICSGTVESQWETLVRRKH